jgi:tetratricopeptide (TPR) repeat protein
VSNRRAPWEEWNEAGLHAFRSGDYSEAEAHFRRAVEEAEKTDPGGVAVAKSLNNLAEACRTQRKYAEAEGVYRQALAIKEQALGAAHPDVATGLSNLAGLRYALGDLIGAERLFKRALAILEASLGPDHPEAAKCLSNLAGVYHMQRRSVEAEALYRCALEIREKALGLQHPDVAHTLTNLATVCQALGKQTEAEALTRRAAAISGIATETAAAHDAMESKRAAKRRQGTGET